MFYHCAHSDLSPKVRKLNLHSLVPGRKKKFYSVYKIRRQETAGRVLSRFKTVTHVILYKMRYKHDLMHLQV